MSIKKIVIASISGVFLVSVAFYWFQWRPSKIRQECSWIKKHTDSLKGTTTEEAQKFKEECLKKAKTEFAVTLCNIDIAHSPQPAKDWYEPAKEAEYNFCLHSKGLR